MQVLLFISTGSRDRYESDRYRDGPRRDNDRYEGGRDRYRDRYDDRDRRDYDRGGGSFCLFQPCYTRPLLCFTVSLQNL